MRRLLALFLLGVLGALLLPAAPAHAACAKPPGRSSPAGRAKIKSHPYIALGTIGSDVPPDAHGHYSFYLIVRQWLAGSGPQRIVVTSYGELDHRPGFERPGTRKRESLEFVSKNAGQEAILFLDYPDNARGRDKTGRYIEQYATTGCTYNVVRTAQVGQFLPLLLRILSQPASQPSAPPVVVPTASPHAAAESPEDEKSGMVTRAAVLAGLVAVALGLFRSPKSPLFEHWRRPSS